MQKKKKTQEICFSKIQIKTNNLELQKDYKYKYKIVKTKQVYGIKRRSQGTPLGQTGNAMVLFL